MHIQINNIREIGFLPENRIQYSVSVTIFDTNNAIIFNDNLEVRFNTYTRQAFPNTNYLKSVITDDNTRNILIYYVRQAVQNYAYNHKKI